MARCSAIAKSGERCKGTPIGDSGLCYVHTPETAETRKRYGRKGGRRGGRGRPLAKLQAIEDRLQELARQVIDKEVDRADAAVVGQLLNYALRGISVSLKAKEVEELEQRLEELEGLQQGGGKRWGA